jgi:hypothetical protein
MSSSTSDTDLSELERELELEFQSESSRDEGQEFQLEPEPESSRDEGQEFQLEPEPESSHDEGQEFELQLETDEKIEAFANELQDLSGRTYESELEENAAVERVQNEMEREYFSFGSLVKKLTPGAKLLLKKVAPKLLGKVPVWGNVFNAATALARGDFKGLMNQGLKAALQVAAPGVGTAAAAGMNALGFEAGDSYANKEAWRRFVEANRDGYHYLAQNLNENSDEPIEASRLAHEAFSYALTKNAVSTPPSYVTPSRTIRPTRRVLPYRRRKYSVIRLKPGQTLVVKCRNY